MQGAINHLLAIIERAKLGMVKLCIIDLIEFLKVKDAALSDALDYRLKSLICLKTTDDIDEAINKDICLKYLMPALFDAMAECEVSDYSLKEITVAVE